MTELERAIAFEEGLRHQAVDEVVPFRFGEALLTPSLPHVWDLNVLRVLDANPSAEELAAEAERVLGGAGLAHRRVVADDEALLPGFKELGWETNRFVFMAHRGGDTRKTAEIAVQEVERDALLPLREALVREAPWGDNDETVSQILAAQTRAAKAGRARHFVVLVDGEGVSAAELYSDGRTAQVEDVITLSSHRNRGYATAVILHAVEAALAAGHDFVFLVADAEDWPKELYARLGFEAIGHTCAFQRRPSAAS
jgi:ribosomal protein S18 acetylase RimI-like enzyme